MSGAVEGMAVASPTPPEDVLAVVPARVASTRLPRKPLQLIAGRPIIAHVIEAVSSARRVGRVLVATDDSEIVSAARDAGAEAILTRSDHPSGSDRIGEAIQAQPGRLILNVQGDEPLLPSSAVDALVDLLDANPWAQVSTLAVRCAAADAARGDANVVKVVAAESGRAHYFSRAAVPGQHPSLASAGPWLRHVGLYGYRREALERFLAAPVSRLEQIEGLEQLRLLELDLPIIVGRVDDLPRGVDTPEDLARCRALLEDQADPRP